MKISVHPQAIEAFNRKAETLLQGVVRKPIIQHIPPSFIPEFDIQTVIDAEMTDNIFEEGQDKLRSTVSKFLLTKEGKIGLDTEQYRKLRLLAEDIYKRQEIKPYISLKTIEDEIFEWVINQSRGLIKENLFDHILPNLENAISEMYIIIPVRYLSTPFTFALGKMTFEPLNKLFFDRWEQGILNHPILNTPEMKIKFSEYKRILQGHSACTLRILAEQRRAQEIALEEAEIAISLFRVFADPLLGLGIRSLCHLWRGQDNAQYFTLVANNTFNTPPLWNGSVIPTSEPIVLDQERLDIIFQSGFAKIQKLYLSDSKTEFQKDLLRSVLTYSRSSLREDAADQLIYVFTAIDSFLLRNSNESIQQNIGDRIAFIVGKTPQERIDIKNNVIEAYVIRSKAIHHGQSIHEQDTLSDFLKNIFFFFVSMIDYNEKYKTRDELFDEIERKKFT